MKKWPQNDNSSNACESFSEESFVVSEDKLFCTAYQKELPVKASMLQLHIKYAKHWESKVHLEHKEKCEHDIAATMKTYDNEVQTKGETLPKDECVYRMKFKNFDDYCVVIISWLQLPLLRITIDAYRIIGWILENN